MMFHWGWGDLPLASCAALQMAVLVPNLYVTLPSFEKGSRTKDGHTCVVGCERLLRIDEELGNCVVVGIDAPWEAFVKS